MATTVTVTYEDGRTDSIPVLPIGLVKAERHFKGELPRVEGTLYAAWAVLKPDVGFEDWLASLAAIDEQTEEAPGPSAEEAQPGP